MPVLAGEVLIVEDNIIIAMEAEDFLRELGPARCHLTGSVASALKTIADHDIAFALLDVDLGRETSEAVAVALRERGTPFIFATGYGEAPAFAGAPGEVPLVTKPFTRQEIAAAIASALTRQAA